MNPERYLLVVSGPSGVGKDTVVRRMRELHPEVGFSVSALVVPRAPGGGATRRRGRGEPVVLVIEVEGAENIKRKYPECTTVFVLPPSREELRRRLSGRGTEDEKTIEKRLARADEELALAKTYDHTVVNDTPDACAEEIYSIFRSRLAED